MRCLALAFSWKKHGGRVMFCGYIQSKTLQTRLTTNGFEIIEPEAGVDATLRLLKDHGLKRGWIVLDGYHFGYDWQDSLTSAGYSVLCIDDGALMPRYSVRVILATDPSAKPLHYPVSSDTIILAGANYRLLQPEFAALRRQKRRTGPNLVVLVTFGGADTSNATRSVLLALDAVLDKTDKVIVVLGSLNVHRQNIEEILAQVSYRHELLQDVQNMAKIFERADLAVGAGGGTAWEMAAAGLPAVLVPVALNQEIGAEYLDRKGAAIHLKGSLALQSARLTSTINELKESPERLAAMSSIGPMISDGKGADRVCAIMRSLDDRTKITNGFLRPATEEDVGHIFRLANDPVLRSYSFSPEPICFDDHIAWFTNKLASQDTVFYVLDLNGVIAASVRYDRSGGDAEVDLAVHSAFRGKGVGTKILLETVETAIETLSVGGVKAVVFAENTASCRCFLKAGFSETDRILVKGRACLTYRFNSRSRVKH